VKNGLLFVLVSGMLVGGATGAEAATKPSLELILASRGMSKGLAQTTGPQYQARGELPFGHFFVGAYAKNIDSATSKGEAGATVGVCTKAGGFDLALSATWKRALSPAKGFDKDALEVSGSVARKMGAFTPKMSIVWSPDDLGGTRRSTFVEAGTSYALRKTVAVSAAIGWRQRSGAPDYTAWNAGLSWTPDPHWLFEARYYDTDGGSTEPYRARGVVAAHLRF
jgi:hypothetical protein